MGALLQGRLDSTEKGICLQGNIEGRTARYFVGGDTISSTINVENASRASKQGLITPENLEPNPKNPIISAFFRNIGRADRLGSGVRNLYKYSKYYAGEEPSFMEGDVFRIVVPLNDEYSFDFDASTADKKPESADKVPIKSRKVPIKRQRMACRCSKRAFLNMYKRMEKLHRIRRNYCSR